jgi:hypothetical protein
MAKKQVPVNNYEAELAALRGKSGDDFTKFFKSSSTISTDTLNLLYLNGMDVIAREADILKQLEAIDPNHPKLQETINDGKKIFEGTINTIQDYIDAVYDYFEYYHAIKTEEQLAYEFERANRYVQYSGIDIPVVLEFDYQFYTKASIFQKPTFYSYANIDTVTKFGKGAYHIAFPSSQALLTDDEVMVAMKHEFGHIYQGHCTATLRDNFEKSYSNAAMDISINLGMTEAEQALLVTLAHKIWKNNQSYPCLSLAKPDGQGGYGIPQPVSPTDWRGTLGWIKAYHKKKDGGDGGGGTGGGGGGGGGGTPGNEPPKQPEIQKVKVGDYIKVIGSEPAIYGRVTSIDDVTGNIETKDYTIEEWDVIKKSM